MTGGWQPTYFLCNGGNLQFRIDLNGYALQLVS
jgi:hypothetical protein